MKNVALTEVDWLRFAVVYPSFWVDPDIRNLGRDARELYLYLMTGPQLNMAGYYYLPMSYMVEHLDTEGYRNPFEGVSDAILRLTNEGKILYDPDAKVMFLRKFLGWNRPKGDLQIKGVLAAVRDVPKSRILSEFVATAKEYVPEAAISFETLSKGFQIPIETPSVTETVSGTETRTKIRSKSKDISSEYTQEFESFWAIYPRRTGKKPAYAKWQARIKEGVSVDELLLCAKNYATLCQGKEEQFIKQPETFLGPNERWKDYLVITEQTSTVNGKRAPTAFTSLRDWAEEGSGH